MKKVLNNKNEFCVGSYKKVMYRPIGVPMKTQNREKIDIQYDPDITVLKGLAIFVYYIEGPLY